MGMTLIIPSEAQFRKEKFTWDELILKWPHPFTSVILYTQRPYSKRWVSSRGRDLRLRLRTEEDKDDALGVALLFPNLDCHLVTLTFGWSQH